MRILITGANGFIGGSLARLAAAERHEVVSVVRRAPPTPGATGEVVYAADAGALVRLLDELAPDAVVHAAGAASVARSMTAPGDDFAASVSTWIEVLESIRRSTIRPVVLLPSSAAVYGEPSRLPVTEDAPLRPISPYGFHKVAAELLAEEYARCFEFNVIVARLFSVFGPRQRRLLVWELFEQMAGPREAVTLQGSGEETRDFLHVDDLGGALLELVARRRAGGPLGHSDVVNVASGAETSVLELARTVRELCGSEKPIRCKGEARVGDPRRWCADVTRLAGSLRAHRPDRPWPPRSIASALAACVTSWREEGRDTT